MKGKRPEYGEWARISYSQEAEDLLLFNVYKRQKQGFYVDVGAHHPRRFSNTHIFFEYGWRGINIDAHPETIALFEIERPTDINLHMAISDDPAPITLQMFDEAAVSTFDRDLADSDKRAAYTPTGTLELMPRPLESVLDEYLPDGQAIDFLNIDVEGLDLNVLRSNDWTRYRPTFVLVESLDRDPAEAKSDPHYMFMISKEYRLYCQTPRTLFFRDATA